MCRCYCRSLGVASGDPQPATNYFCVGPLKPRARTIRLTPAAIVHMKAWATSTANIAAGVKCTARTTTSAKAPATAPNTTRSAQKEDLYAIETAIKITNAKMRVLMRSSRCRTPLVIEAHDHTHSTKQKSETRAHAARLLSSAWRLIARLDLRCVCNRRTIL